jgi:glycosyltransferase involved in cell wall biosynthesis
MVKSICILLNNSIANDYRVIKTIHTLSKKATVDLFYLEGDVEQDKAIFNDNVRLFNLPKNDSFKQKVIRHTCFTREYLAFVNLVISQNKNYDIVWANDLPTLLPAAKIADKKNAKLVYDSHEIYTETLNQFFPIKSSFFKHLIFRTLLSIMKRHGGKTERKLVKKTDFFITVNESILAYFQSIYAIKNGQSIMNLPYKNISVSSPINFRQKFDLNTNDIICLYQGVLNEGRGLKRMIDAIEQCETHIKLIIIGSGVLELELKKQASSLIGKRIFFIPQVPLNELPNYTSGADFGINFLEDFNLSKKMASPNKLFEYIHAGIPVLCSTGLENEKVLNNFNVGIATEIDIVHISMGINEMSEKVRRKETFDGLESAKLFYCWESQEDDLFAILA